MSTVPRTDRQAQLTGRAAANSTQPKQAVKQALIMNIAA
jgi:hypothetical protein